MPVSYVPLKGNAGTVIFTLIRLRSAGNIIPDYTLNVAKIHVTDFEESNEESSMNSTFEDLNGDLQKNHFGYRQVISFSVVNSPNIPVPDGETKTNRKAIQQIAQMINIINNYPKDYRLQIQYRDNYNEGTIQSAKFTGTINLRELSAQDNIAQSINLEFKSKTLSEPNLGNDLDEIQVFHGEDDANPIILTAEDGSIFELESNPFDSPYNPSIILDSKYLVQFVAEYGSYSEVQSYNLTASGLRDDVVITAEYGFEISQSETDGFDTKIIVPKNFNGPIYIRLNGTILGESMANILHLSMDAMSILSVSKKVLVAAPVIIVNAEGLVPFEAEFGAPGESQTFSVSCDNLTDDIVISKPADTDFELSLDDVTFSDSVSISPVDGVVEETTVYVRLAGENVGEFDGGISIESEGADTELVEVEGEVTSIELVAPEITLNVNGTISITCDTPDTTIYYTRDGSTPNPASLIPTGTTFQYSQTSIIRTLIPITVKAIAVHAELGTSDTSTYLQEDMIKTLLELEMTDFGGAIVDEEALDEEIAYIKANGLYGKIGYLIGKDWCKRTGTDAEGLLNRTTKVAFSFDDGVRSASLATAARLEAVGARGTFYINPAFIGRTFIGQTYLTWDDIATLRAAGHEVSDHGYTHSIGEPQYIEDNASPDVTDLTDAQLFNELHMSDQSFVAHNIPSPLHYAVPKYQIDPDSTRLIMQYRRTIRGYNPDDYNYMPKDYSDPHGRNWAAYYAISYQALTEVGYNNAKAELDRAILAKDPVFMATHSTDNTPNYFEQLLDYIVNTCGLEIVTCAELIDEINDFTTKYYNLVKSDYEVISHLDKAWVLGDDENGFVVFNCLLSELPAGTIEHYQALGFSIAFWDDTSAEAFAYMFPNNDIFLDAEPVTCDTNYALSRFAIPGIAGVPDRFPSSGQSREPVTLSGNTPPGGLSFGTTYYAQNYASTHLRLYDAMTGGNLITYSSVGSNVKMTSTSRLQSKLWNYTPSSPLPADCVDFRCLKRVCRITRVDATSNGAIFTTVGGSLKGSNLHYFAKLSYQIRVTGMLDGAVDGRIRNIYDNHTINYSYGYLTNFLNMLTVMSGRRWINYVYMQYNSLNETIPEFIAELTRCIVLNLSQNSLTGAIPVEMASVGTLVTSTQSIILNNNSLSSYETGAIGTSQKQLGIVNFGANAITNQGQIDQIIADLLALVGAGGKSTGTLTLNGGTNAAPSATGSGNLDILEGYTGSGYNWTTVTTAIGIVASPTASPDGGSVSTTDPITLATATSGAYIYYTIDGSTPTKAKTKYTGTFTLPAGTITVKAIAVKGGYTASAVMTKTFTVA